MAEKPDFGQMIGPLPMGAWVGVIAAGVGIALYARRRASPAPVAAANPVTAAGLNTIPGYVANPSGGGTSGGYTSNEAWQRGTEVLLIAQGADPVLTDRALRDYLGGVQLDAQEAAILTLALRASGPPPLSPAAGPAPLEVPRVTGPGTQSGPTTGGAYGFSQFGAHAVATALRHDGQGGYTLDSFGGIHPFATAGTGVPPQPVGGPYWPGQSRAVGLALNGNDTGGYVLDDEGAAHPFMIPPRIPITTDGRPTR